MSAKPWWGIAAVALIAAAAIGWQEHVRATWQRRIEVAQSHLREVRRIPAENARAGGGSLPTVTDDDLAAAHADLATLSRELEAKRAIGGPAALPPGRFGVGARLAATEWRNAGNATPEATFETVLWAAAGGDVDTFAGALTYVGPSDAKAARALFDTLPAAVQSKYGTPEKLIAALTIPDVPLGAVQINDWSDAAERRPSRLVSALFTGPDGATKQRTLIFLRRNDGWKLAVTKAALARYALQLAGDPGH